MFYKNKIITITIFLCKVKNQHIIGKVGKDEQSTNF